MQVRVEAEMAMRAISGLDVVQEEQKRAVLDYVEK